MEDKYLVWLHGEIKSPPLSSDARIETGFLLRRLQQGELLTMPHARPMPVIGAHCYELRIQDKDRTWRLVYRIAEDAILILEVFEKKTPTTPRQTIERCRRRLALYDRAE